MTERKFASVKPDDGDLTFIRASNLLKDGVTGEVLQGTFLESIPNRIDERKLDFKFEKEDGTIVIVNGAGNLGYNMKFVDVGEYIQIVYLGQQEITKGPQKGRMAHNFEVNREE